MDIPVGTIELPHQRSATSIPNKISPSKKLEERRGDTNRNLRRYPFSIDTPLVSFGRDTSCSVRLHYAAVAPLHARRLQRGSEGVRGGGGGKKTALLTHGSEFEIHGKRFRFTYPPKEMRAALAASPARPPRRSSPALHTIHDKISASYSLRSVYSPNPVLAPHLNPQSSPVLRLTESPTPSSHPRIVEEAKDFVILEEVEVVAPGKPRFIFPYLPSFFSYAAYPLANLFLSSSPAPKPLPCPLHVQLLPLPLSLPLLFALFFSSSPAPKPLSHPLNVQLFPLPLSLPLLFALPVPITLFISISPAAVKH
ncbi:hypothetical protein B0H14DRAFT_3867318 [Mycena olivaceomarginata]|nr:hypothetical protein B0H14DRAFT_3867318 [Mycena olivaceomarginata]